MFGEAPVEGGLGGPRGVLVVFPHITDVGTKVEGEALIQFETTAEAEFGVTIVVGFNIPEVNDICVGEAKVTREPTIDFLCVLEVIRFKHVVNVTKGRCNKTEVLGGFAVEIKFIDIIFCMLNSCIVIRTVPSASA